MENADGIIISTPVYVMQVTAGLKALLDHMAYCYLNHKPRFFKHKVLIVVTTAGAGISNCKKYIKENLSFWGIGKVLTFGKAMNAANWQEVPPKIKVNAEKELKLKAVQFYNAISSKKITKPTFLQAIMFVISKSFTKGFEKTNSDRIYWENNGWLDDKAEYYMKGIKLNILQRIIGKILKKVLFRNSNKSR
jgi:multimeric flavodoxin WrbA